MSSSGFQMSCNRIGYACGCVRWLEWQEKDNRWWPCWFRSSRCKISHSEAP